MEVHAQFIPLIIHNSFIIRAFIHSLERHSAAFHCIATYQQEDNHSRWSTRYALMVQFYDYAQPLLNVAHVSAFAIQYHVT